MKIQAIAAVAALLLSSCAAGNKAAESEAIPEHGFTIMAGSYTEPGDTALRLLHFDPADSSLTVIDGTTEVPNASYMAQATRSGMIYVVSEGDSMHSRITALRPAGKHSMPSIACTLPVGSAAPCYVSVSPDERYVVTADYNGGTATIFGISSTGMLTPVKQRLRFTGSGPVAGRQDTPHPHCATFTPDGRFLLVNDLCTDRINMFPVAQEDSDSLVITDQATQVQLPAGAGPRHIVFNAKGNIAYLINEISDTVTVLDYNKKTLIPRQHLAADTALAHGAGDIQLSPDLRNLYASLRLKHEGIATFDVNTRTGEIRYKGHTPTAAHPRNFLITPDGLFLLVACKNDGIVQVFSRNPASGALTDTGHSLKIPGVVCLKTVNL